MGKQIVRIVLFNLVLALMAFPTVLAQQAKPAPTTKSVVRPATKPVATNPNNKELIELAQGGASERNLLGAVAAAKAEGRTYGKSAKEILALTKAGVSDVVIEAIRAIGTLTTASVQPTAPASVVVNMPSTQHVGVSLDQPSTVSLDGREAGIYLAVTGKDMEQLEPSVYSGSKSGNKLFAMVPVFGKASSKAVVRSAAANQRLQNSLPTFYFFFEVKGAGLSNTGGTFAGYMNSASSPNEFVLARLKVSKGERELILAEVTHFKDRTGVRPEDTVDFVIKRIKPGVYEVRPKNPLPPGEYCFFYQGGAAMDTGGVGKLFDFGVDSGTGVQ